MFLLINTVNNDRIIFGLADSEKIIKRYGLKVGRKQAEKLLFSLDKFLQKSQIKLRQLKGIVVVSGPGPFTSVRLGIILANTLGYALDTPVVGIQVDSETDLETQFLSSVKKFKKNNKFTFLKPDYGGEPNITKSKKVLHLK